MKQCNILFLDVVFESCAGHLNRALKGTIDVQTTVLGGLAQKDYYEASDRLLNSIRQSVSKTHYDVIFIGNCHGAGLKIAKIFPQEMLRKLVILTTGSLGAAEEAYRDIGVKRFADRGGLARFVSGMYLS